MNEKEYPVQFEISGPYAMFTRPDTGSAFVAYHAPTWSACKGMFEAVARLKSAYIHPAKVEICAPVNFHRYVTNYGGPLRKGNQLKGGDSYQLGAYVLVDVCYRVYGVVREFVASPDPRVNHCHYLQDLFTRRLEKGRFYDTPCLGWRECVPNCMTPKRCAYSRMPAYPGREPGLPIIPVTLTYHGQARTIQAVVDSGASMNVLPYDIGLQVGLIWEIQTFPLPVARKYRSFWVKPIFSRSLTSGCPARSRSLRSPPKGRYVMMNSL